jgi:galactokinase
MHSEHTSGLNALRQRAHEAFVSAYGREPTLFVAAPGRVNLIGEHTDYNDGFVLPAAIDRHIVLAVAPREDRTVRLHALDFAEHSQFSLDALDHDEQAAWSNYERGVAWALQGAGYTLSGLDGVITGDVPIGSGLSSSAAIEVATALAFQTLGDLDLDDVERALLCQKAENQFVGMNCGIMDQYIVSLGKRGHALLIDCRSLEYELVPVPDGCDVVICDTKKRRGLVDSEYNRRREECERGSSILGVKALRDVSVETFAARQGELDEITRMRCRHVITENQRTLNGVTALRNGDVARFGALMNDSHTSLRDDYEVSCRELDIMVEAAQRQPGTLGSRMTGAGFGGCTVSLVRSEHTPAFAREVAKIYTESTGVVPDVYVCQAEDGVRRLN